jgi:hypothetical protein
MYANLHLLGLGSFQNEPYWTSTEIDASQAYHMDFNVGVHDSSLKTDTNPNIRACRNFYGSAGAYAVGDIGPQGGWIFYEQTAVDPDYAYFLEAAPSDLTPNMWSNLIGDEIGATAQNTTVFLGYDNTLAIVGQSGHTTSAANDCLNSSYGSTSVSSSPSSSPS